MTINSTTQDMKSNKILFQGWTESSPSSPETGYHLKIMSVNGWDSSVMPNTPTPSSGSYWTVLQMPMLAYKKDFSSEIGGITQLWISVSTADVYSRSYITSSDSWTTFKRLSS